MKKLVSALSIAGLAVLFAGVASAASVSSVDDESEVKVNNKSTFTASVTNNNSANITNTVVSGSNTGGNVVYSDDDQEGTRVTTGNATSEAVVTNAANDSAINITAEGGCGCVDTVRNVTDESKVKVLRSDNTTITISTNSTAQANNQAASFADTGNNKIFSGDSLRNAVFTTGTGATATIVSNFFNRGVINVTRTPGN